MTDAPKKKRKKRKKRITPTQLTMREIKRRGWIAGIVEKVVPYSFIKQDLFGCIDIVAIEHAEGVSIDSGALVPGVIVNVVTRHGAKPISIIGIQATSALTGGNHAARRAKILAEPRARAWLEAGGKLEVWSWRKAGARGERKLWTLRREPITLAMFDEQPKVEPDVERDRRVRDEARKQRERPSSERAA